MYFIPRRNLKFAAFLGFSASVCASSALHSHHTATWRT